MITVPLNLSLRDLNIEKHDVTDGDSFIYNSIYGMMNSLIDIVNEIDPSLSLYRNVFRSVDRDVIFHSEKFFIQYDGADEYRLIWRDFVVGWYKHPRRCLQANRELSVAEQACLLSEFRTEMVLYFETSKSSTSLPKERPDLNGRVCPFEAMYAALDKMHRNVTFGSRAPSPRSEVYGSNPLDKTLTDESLADLKNFGDKSFNTPIRHRMTQGQFGDYAAAAERSDATRRIWEHIKAEGIDIITEDQKSPGEKMGIGDLSVMFMYPNEIKPLDLSKLDLTPELEERYKHMRETAAEFKPVMATAYHDPSLTLAAEAAERDFKMPKLTHLRIGNGPDEVSDMLGMIHYVPRGDGAFLKSNMASLLITKQRQPLSGAFELNLEMPMTDYEPFILIDSLSEFPGEPGFINDGVKGAAGCEVVDIDIEKKGPSTAPPFYVRHGRVRPKKLADMVKFALFTLYHPMMK